MRLEFCTFPMALRPEERLLSYKPIYGEDGILLKINTSNRVIARMYDYQSNDYHQDIKMLDAILESQPAEKAKYEYHYL